MWRARESLGGLRGQRKGWEGGSHQELSWQEVWGGLPSKEGEVGGGRYGVSHPERGDYGSLPSNLGRVEESSWQEAGGGGSPILRGEVGLPHPIWGGSSGIE